MDSQFSIKKGYRARSIDPIYHDESREVNPKDPIYQAEIYEVVANIGRHLKCDSIIDVGCGGAAKLVKLHPEFKVSGVDYGANIQRCRELYPFGNWFETDFETCDELSLGNVLTANSMVVCADVIEHLRNPVNLLNCIRKMLECAKIAFISTPDRNLKGGLQDSGPPSNIHHVREWTNAELTNFIKNLGFDVIFSGLTQTHNQCPARNTSLIIVKGNLGAEELPKTLFPPTPNWLRYQARVLRKSFGVWRESRRR